MDTIEIKNAVITATKLSFAERGILDCWVYVDYGGVNQGFGGFALYLPKDFKHFNILSPAGHFIYRVMEIAGVEDWDKVVGKSIRVKGTWSKAQAIGHIIKDDWFCPEDDFKGIDKPKE